jgi:hypothetical protein
VDRLTVLQPTCRKLPELKPVTSNQIIQSYDCISMEHSHFQCATDKQKPGLASGL